MSKVNRSHRYLHWLWLSLVVIVLDHLTKRFVTHWMFTGAPGPMIPMINITLAHNQGTAFSWLSHAGGWQRWVLSLIAIIVSVAIIQVLRRLPARENFQACALSLILGGALGNLWDRLAQGYVIDFLDFHLGSWHLFIFNLADLAITLGAGMLIWQMIRKK